MSASLMAGMTGAIITAVGMPASDRLPQRFQPSAPVWRRAAPSCARACGSSVVTEIATLARLRSAMRDRMSMSRVTSADLVTMPTGWPCALQHLEDAAHDLVLLLDRLIRIGIGADRDGARRIARCRQFTLQQGRRLRLHEQLGFEIEPRRQAEIGMGRPREAIDAAMLAAAIRIDRAVEARCRATCCG